MMASLLVVARTAPASEDGVQLGGVKRPRVLTVRIAREPAETSGAIKEPGPRLAATRLADGQRGDERAVRRRVLLHQALQGFRHPMDGMGWQYLKSVRQLLVGNEDSALRDAFEKCTRACMRRHPIVLSESSALSAAKVTRLASRLLVSKYPPALTRVPRDATAIVLIFFSCDVTAAGPPLAQRRFRYAEIMRNTLDTPPTGLDQPHRFPFELIRETPLFIPAHSYLLYPP